jgi:hypothetical protein
MLPVAVLQFAGLILPELVIAGVGFITTATVPGTEGQLPAVAVTIAL